MKVFAEVEKATPNATTDSLLPGEIVKVSASGANQTGESRTTPATETTANPVSLAQGLISRISLPAHGQKSRYLQEKVWLGMVTGMERDSFTARLKDYESGPDLVTDFDIQEIPLEDVELVRVGAEFYWSLGYCDEPNGQRQRYSWIRFRRLPKWTTKAIQQAQTRAQELMGELLEESDGPS